MENAYRNLLLIWLSLMPRGRQIKNIFVDDIERLNALWNMDKYELEALNKINERFWRAMIDKDIKFQAEEAYRNAQSENIKVFSKNDKEYPVLLKMTADAPAVIFCKGNIDICDNSISVIGSRKATAYGLKAAFDIGAALAERGVCVVSGMARGIDSKAHWGALEAGGRTCAVLGCGADVVYPPENGKLWEKIAEKGAVISEYAPGTPPLAQHFPARNRIISGLSKGIVVVEAGKESGTMITVDFALEQGRDVFAVPGNIYSERSVGTNNLIKDGAKLFSGIKDIEEEYNFTVYREDKNACALRIKLKEAIESGETDFYESELFSGYSVKEINTELMYMQIDGIIYKEENGEYYIK